MDFERPDQPEQIDEFEQELKLAMGRRPAPPNLKRRVMQQRNVRRMERRHAHVVWWQRVAASLVLTGVVAGGFAWRQEQDRRKGEEAKQQVLMALRITNRVLNDMNRRLVEHDREEK